MLVLAAVCAFRPFGTQQLRSTPRTSGELSLLSASEAVHCGKNVEDIDLWTGVALYQVQSVRSATDCMDKCTTDSRCGAWTWGKKRDVKYLSDVCWLKELRPGHPIERHPKKGVVSGMPCRADKERSSSSGQPAKFNCRTGFNNWKAGWSRAKKKWCCANMERACDSNSRPSTSSETAEKAPPLVDCHDVAHDVDYWTGRPLYEVDNIGQAVDCRKKCEADPNCWAWTWGEKPGIPGLEGVCFLKGRGDGQVRQDHKGGVQSGIPCRRDGAGGSGSGTSAADKGSDSSRSSAADSVVAELPHPTGDGNCGEIADDTDYSTSTSLSEVINIATPEICLYKCEGDLKCRAWSWGKARHSIGLTDVCFLKGLREGETPKRQSKQGVVSGLPCHTSSWLAKETKDGGAGLQHYQSATVYCFALMIPGSYEQKLLRMQYYEHASLFACNEYTVYSNLSIDLAPGLMTHVVDSNLHCEFGGEFGTALNTDIFLAVWKKVVSDGIYLTCEWSAKVDPDAVFFAARLRGALEAHHEAPEGVYINNCWRGMHGPVEVFSRNAVTAWSQGTERCIAHFNKLCNGPCLWGEDMFIDQCLEKVLKVRRDNEYALLTEDHCDPPSGWKDCKIAGSISFHPFKDPARYQECLFNADPLARFATTPTTTTEVAMVYPSESGEGVYSDSGDTDQSLSPYDGSFPATDDGSLSADDESSASWQASETVTEEPFQQQSAGMPMVSGYGARQSAAQAAWTQAADTDASGQFEEAYPEAEPFPAPSPAEVP